MPLSLATFRDQSNLELNSLFIGAMAACSLVLNSFPDTIIRMVVAFVAGEPRRDDDVFPLWKHPRKLVPLSRRFVPEPVEMTYIVSDLPWGHLRPGQSTTLRRRDPAGLASAIGHVIRETPRLSHNVRMAGSDERICSICVYGAAEAIHNVHQVTLQTRLRRPFWPNTEAFRAFISDRIEHVEINVCRNCVSRCNMSVRGGRMVVRTGWPYGRLAARPS